MLEEGDPLAMRLFAEYPGIRMPNLGLRPGEVSAVVAYMKGFDDRKR